MKRGWTQIIADKNSVILSLIIVFLCDNLCFLKHKIGFLPAE